MRSFENVQVRVRALGIQASDVEERFVRGSGPGGQKIHKTSSTVWLRHIPTGVEVRCQEQRSQFENRVSAWHELCDKMEALVAAKRNAMRQTLEKARRQVRQKSRGQKVKMIRMKKHRAKQKAGRGRVGDE